MHQLIDAENLTNDISCVSTIYDSIYYLVRNDVATIKWLNDRVVPIITADFMQNQAIKNAAAGEIGYDWASLKPIPNDASTGYILATRHLLLHKDHEINVLQAKKEKTPDDFARIAALWTQLVAHYEST